MMEIKRNKETRDQDKICRANKQEFCTAHFILLIKLFLSFLHTEKKPAASATRPNKTDGNFGSNESFK